MSNPTIMAFLVVYSVLALVLLISAIFAFGKMRRQNHIWRLMVADTVTRCKLMETARNREREVGQVFAKILFDLAHTDNAESIQWKLMCLRQTKDALIHNPHALNYYDGSYHNWLIDMITKASPQCKEDVLAIIRKWTKGYYVMDPQSGEDITKVIEKLMTLEESRGKNQQVWLQQFQEFTNYVRDTKFNFPIVDVRPKKEEPVRKMSFEEIIAEINSDLNLWGTSTDEEVTENEGSDESDQRTEEHTEGLSEDTAEELQGEEVESIQPEAATESEHLSEGSEVIVMSGSKAV